MRLTRLATVLLFACAMAACPRDRNAEIVTDTAAVAPPDDPAAVPEAAQTITLEALAAETITAEAVVLPIGSQTQITVAIHQAPPATPYTGHVMIGNCEAPGPTSADLQPIRTDAEGRGASRTVVNVRPEIIVNGNHLIQLRRDDERPGVPAGCGEIEAHPVLYETD